MDRDMLQDKLKQFRNAVKQRWGALTDNDLDEVMRKPAKLAGLLQERYGYTTKQAREEIGLFVDDIKAKGENIVEVVLETLTDETPGEEAHIQ